MIAEQINAIIGEKLDMDPASIPQDVSFKDMKVDSLYVVEILLTIEETFDIVIEDASGLTDVNSLVAYVESQVQDK